MNSNPSAYEVDNCYFYFYLCKLCFSIVELCQLSFIIETLNASNFYYNAPHSAQRMRRRFGARLNIDRPPPLPPPSRILPPPPRPFTHSAIEVRQYKTQLFQSSLFVIVRIYTSKVHDVNLSYLYKRHYS